MNVKDMKYIEIAKNCSTKSVLKSKHGAVLVSKNKLISYGINHNRCRFGGSYKVFDLLFQKNMDCSSCCACHAEIDVLYKAILNIPNKSSLFKSRLKKSLFLQVQKVLW